jgi:hypothetical protein
MEDIISEVQILILPFLQPPELVLKIDDDVLKVFITGNNSERRGELFWL